MVASVQALIARHGGAPHDGHPLLRRLGYCANERSGLECVQCIFHFSFLSCISRSGAIAGRLILYCLCSNSARQWLRQTSCITARHVAHGIPRYISTIVTTINRLFMSKFMCATPRRMPAFTGCDVVFLHTHPRSCTKAVF